MPVLNDEHMYCLPLPESATLANSTFPLTPPATYSRHIPFLSCYQDEGNEGNKRIAACICLGPLSSLSPPLLPAWRSAAGCALRCGGPMLPPAALLHRVPAHSVALQVAAPSAGTHPPVLANAHPIEAEASCCFLCCARAFAHLVHLICSQVPCQDVRCQPLPFLLFRHGKAALVPVVVILSDLHGCQSHKCLYKKHATEELLPFSIAGSSYMDRSKDLHTCC